MGRCKYTNFYGQRSFEVGQRLAEKGRYPCSHVMALDYVVYMGTCSGQYQQRLSSRDQQLPAADPKKLSDNNDLVEQ